MVWESDRLITMQQRVDSFVKVLWVVLAISNLVLEVHLLGTIDQIVDVTSLVTKDALVDMEPCLLPSSLCGSTLSLGCHDLIVVSRRTRAVNNGE